MTTPNPSPQPTAGGKVPVECTECDKESTDQFIDIDADHPGWICGGCYKKLQERSDE